MTPIARQARAVNRGRGAGARNLIKRGGDLAFETRERRHDFGHTLAGQILKIAGLEDLGHLVANVLRKPLFGSAFERRRQVVGGNVDVFRRRQNLLRRLLAGLHNSFQFARDVCGTWVRPAAAGWLLSGCPEDRLYTTKFGRKLLNFVRP
jgi:hypothetical protein